ncbi:translation initiation factor 3 [Holotrichia oblita]|uniref:Translation initiation factor 3 n=1 Tax=Holotrichia oblita TaxID=644536 RepID=A0ACB9T6P4_HOLOL|nr:translation initiation factor 3 [Holotrichia oblita]
MTGAEYLQEDLKQRELRKTEKDASNAIKGDKVLIISCNISEHDLKTQLNKITKWMSKHYEVKVVINGNATNMEKAEGVYDLLEKEMLNTGRIVQKRRKGNDIKFQIIPPKKKT